MTVMLGHGRAIVADPTTKDLPFDQQRVITVEVPCPGDRCSDCETEAINRAIWGEPE